MWVDKVFKLNPLFILYILMVRLLVSNIFLEYNFGIYCYSSIYFNVLNVFSTYMHVNVEKIQ